jgi:NAD(P)-dependent dehydrogenase (short-subunit alcohol dehydrogenase family)
MALEKNLIVITGCDSGIGKGLCALLLKRGFLLAVSYLEKNPFQGNKSVFAHKMDLRVTKDRGKFASFIDSLIQEGYVLETFINNAGVALGGPVEDLPMDVFRENFEINYFGAVELIQRMIPHLIKSKGKIIVNGSLAGKVALPFLSPYVSTKHALEGFTDSLRRELKPFGIKTILLEPGSIATPIWNKAKKQDTSFVSKKYRKSLSYFQNIFIEGGNRGLDSDLSAIQIMKILDKKKPKPRYIVSKNPFQDYLKTLIPSRLLDSVLVKAFKMDYGK